MKGMRDKDELAAEINEDGSVNVEGHFVGKLSGLQFDADSEAEGVHGKATRSAATQVLAGEFAMRVRRVVSAKDDAFKLSRAGEILWREMVVGRVESSDDLLKPVVCVVADEDHVAAADRDKIRERLETWLKDLIFERLKPLVDLSESSEVSGLARGIAFQLVENFGILKRDTVSDEVKALDQPARGKLRKYGVRFGAFNIYIPILLKPASAELGATLWALKYAPAHGLEIGSLPEAPRPGLTSFAANPETPEAFYRAYGYQVCGPRVVRLDILERLADQIRPLLAWRRKGNSTEEPPNGSTGEGGFKATAEMMSILGCSPEELSHVLIALGFRFERRLVKASVEGKAVDKAEGAKAAAERKEGEAGSDVEEGKEGVGESGAGSTPLEEASSQGPDVAPGVAVTDSGAQVGAAEAEIENAPASTGEEPAKPPEEVQGVTKSASSEETQGGDDKKAEPAAFEEIWRPKPKRPRAERTGKKHGGRSSRDNQGGRSSRPGERDASGKNQSAGGEKADGKVSAASSGGGHAKGGFEDKSSSKNSRRGGGPKRGRDGRTRGDNKQAQRFSSKAPRKKAKLDPDSPFAALAGLRDELSKPGSKSGSAKDKDQ